ISHPQVLRRVGSANNTILAVVNPIFGSVSNGASNDSSQPGSTIVSGFTKTRCSPAAYLVPRLQPAAKPRLVSDRINSTFGKADAAASALPSTEALSTTITSLESGKERKTESRQASNLIFAL